MLPPAILSTTYFGPVQWYQKLYRCTAVYIDRGEAFQKQSYRNRCKILTANGVQALSVPTEHGGERRKTGEITISSHGRWQHQHWQALQSAYGDSPFFDYYADDIRPFFEDTWTDLFDFNAEITRTICRLIDISPNIKVVDSSQNQQFSAEAETSKILDETVDFWKKQKGFSEEKTITDYRNTIHPKHPLPDSDFRSRRYWQVFESRYGFQPNLSILDLLFCCGPESVLYL